MKTYTAEELAAILDKHHKWLDGKEGGEPADLTYADISAANLYRANLRRTNLYRANLRWTNLHKADLTWAFLFGADLRGANLSGVNLYRANLSGAYLQGADLREADLREADLRGAYLYGANLTGAKMNWQSHDLIAEVLRQAAGDDPEKRMVAGLILVSRDWCWEEFEENCSSHPLWSWAIETLRKYVRDGDNAPAILREEVCDGS